MHLEWERTQASSLRGAKKISIELMKSVRRKTLKVGFSSETTITILLRWAEFSHL